MFSTQGIETAAIKCEPVCSPMGAKSIKKWPKSSQNGRFCAILATFWEIEPAYIQEKHSIGPACILPNAWRPQQSNTKVFVALWGLTVSKMGPNRAKMTVFGQFWPFFEKLSQPM